ncbi:hypothetical protein N7481_011857 [Penicillium waksmanii]|uniref:uncharacterized protein n=1 Tax=Penicillium waksmanii TaxID=69791 RepID=UPI0025466FE5|nr:uncharacterized protein N7481_011857 [Penicillium waksmanii]KAJ5974647.1 hypothetical protein N7481_011857 [Penicillium waksmanii]
MLGFIARINAFCSGVEQLSPGPTPPSTDPPLEQISTLPFGNLQETHAAESDLSSTQIHHLLQIFWSRLRPRMPIVEWKDLVPDGQADAAPSPLLDAITAHTLQYIHQSGLNNRLIGLKWSKFQRRDCRIGMAYFRRSLSAVTQLTTFAVPSISVMKCYCYLVSYLLDAGEHPAAYNMVGLALRISQSLNYMDARTGWYRECQLFRRIWWTLIHLDFRCSRHIGKPVTTHVEELLCMRPTREPGDLQISNGLLYHTESIHLTAAALLVNEATDRFAPAINQDTNASDIEVRAQNLSDHIFHLQKWSDGLPKEQSFANMQLDVPDVPVDRLKAGIEQEPGESPEIENLLSTLLMLQYHNAVMSLHRVFIQFPSYPLVPKSHPKADAHAATALNHAMRMIEIAHKQMKMHEIFYGHSEFYQYQWNAVITIIGFMLAYPYCHRCPRARDFLNLALEIFDSVDIESVIAVRAASLTRHLCSKVDTLVQTLNLGHPTPDSTAPPDPTSEDRASQTSSSNLNLPDLPGDDSMLQRIDGESLWSWADLINLDAWPSYCEEVNEAFMDTADFSIPNCF